MDQHIPEIASRPFDLIRNGFASGNGACIVELGKYQSARDRDANILAEVAEFGVSSDAFHITVPQTNASGQISTMKKALRMADKGAEKSMTVHLLGAAGVIELIYSAQSMQHSIIPPTINLNDPDPIAT